MTLPYSHIFNSKIPVIGGQPTAFINRIWRGLIKNNIAHKSEYAFYYQQWHEKFINDALHAHFDDVDLEIFDTVKIHTIREDKTDRWKPGNTIDAFFFSRRPHMFRIHPRIKCTSTQTIEIREMLSVATNIANVYNNKIYVVLVDGKSLTKEDVKKLALNDGFDSVKNFFHYFNDNFKGKIIHWTDLKY